MGASESQLTQPGEKVNAGAPQSPPPSAPSSEHGDTVRVGAPPHAKGLAQAPTSQEHHQLMEANAVDLTEAAGGGGGAGPKKAAMAPILEVAVSDGIESTPDGTEATPDGAEATPDAGFESARRADILDAYHAAKVQAEARATPRKKSLYDHLAGERLTPEKRAAQQAAFEKLQRRALAKAGKPLPPQPPLETHTALLIALILRHGKRYEDTNTILITFGEVLERYEASPPPGGWSAPCSSLLLHAATYAKLKYTAGGQTWKSKPITAAASPAPSDRSAAPSARSNISARSNTPSARSPLSTRSALAELNGPAYTPRLTPTEDADAVIELTQWMGEHEEAGPCQSV